MQVGGGAAEGAATELTPALSPVSPKRPRSRGSADPPDSSAGASHLLHSEGIEDTNKSNAVIGEWILVPKMKAPAAGAAAPAASAAARPKLKAPAAGAAAPAESRSRHRTNNRPMPGAPPPHDADTATRLGWGVDLSDV